ncbi:MAG: hypothetical protein JWR32_2053 [Mycobacterium sp.]|jgi:hypothetical protein|nr:hypothetical protein [Mycobacterium sp.]
MATPFLLGTSEGSLHCVRDDGVSVHRVGYRPDPWVWTPWMYAGSDGRFHGRWDDPHGTWRTLYVGESELACYLEVLARFRPDPQLQQAMADIDDDDRHYPTAPAGALPRSWCGPRLLASARLHGSFAVPGHQESLPTLRRRFLAMAKAFGLAGLDAAAIRESRPRALTHAISAWIYTLRTPAGVPLNGMQFKSRHGDELTLWTIYERGHAGNSPPELEPESAHHIAPDDPNLREAMRLHRLTWAD